LLCRFLRHFTDRLTIPGKLLNARFDAGMSGESIVFVKAAFQTKQRHCRRLFQGSTANLDMESGQSLANDQTTVCEIDSSRQRVFCVSATVSKINFIGFSVAVETTRIIPAIQ